MLFSIPRADFFNTNDVGSSILKTNIELTNYISSTEKHGDKFLLDGETWGIRSKLSYQYNEQLQFQFHTILLKHSGGISDRFIYHFHDTLSLPQNGRSNEHHDQLFWHLNANELQILSVSDDKHSWGDSEVSISYKPNQLDNIQLNATLKLPSGNYSKQTGSEKPDIHFSISHQNPSWFDDRNFLETTKLSLWYGVGLGYTGQAKQLKTLSQRPVIFSLRTGFSWKPTHNWQLKAQLDSHSPLFDTEIRELGWIPVQISFESTYQISQDTSFNFVIAEDLRPRSVPDVIISTGLAFRF